MTKDKLTALKAAQSEEDFTLEFAPLMADPLDEFFVRADAIRAAIDRLRTDTEEVKRKHEAILCYPHNDDRTKAELEHLMDEITKGARQVRTKMKQIKLETEDEEEWRTSSRIKNTQIRSLEMAVVEVMTEYNRIQGEYRTRCKARLKRQLGIVGKATSDAELDRMLEEGNVAIFTVDIVTETQQAKQRVADIEARHADIIKLERSIKELHDMFLDMAVLVECQGEMMDRIEYNVQKAEDYVEEGKEEFNEAHRIQRRFWKKKLILVGVVVVVAILFMALVTTLWF